MKIAVIEDDHAIRAMYKLKLENEGYYVKAAEDGASGLALVDKFRPDVILLDIKMPVMNGDEMLERLRATDWGSTIKVIILTNISKDEAPASLRLMNVDRYIVKAHHTPSQVLDIVREIVGTDKNASRVAVRQ